MIIRRFRIYGINESPHNDRCAHVCQTLNSLMIFTFKLDVCVLFQWCLYCDLMCTVKMWKKSVCKLEACVWRQHYSCCLWSFVGVSFTSLQFFLMCLYFFFFCLGKNLDFQFHFEKIAFSSLAAPLYFKESRILKISIQTSDLVHKYFTIE